MFCRREDAKKPRSKSKLKSKSKLLKVFVITLALLVVPVAFTVISNAETLRVSESVRLREKPSTDAKILMPVPIGNEIEVLGVNGEWAKIVFEGTTGYIKSEFIEEVSTGISQPYTGTASDGDPESPEVANSNDGALRYGSEGDAVGELQKLLTEKDVYAGPINKKFGPLTEEAVMRFQELRGLEVDGVVGSETLAKLKEKPAGQHIPGTYRNGDSGDEVKNIQQLLKDKGYYDGPTNSKFGPLTEQAVKGFQGLNNLKVDGVVGRITLELLRNAPKKSGSRSTASASSGGDGSGSGGVPSGVEYLEWSKVRGIFSIGAKAEVYDVRSGITYYVKSFSNGKHADVEPITTDDTALLKKTFGGVWQWSPRPVWVTVNGRKLAGSINGMPHGGGVNNSNGMSGQVCIHFKGSSTHNGNAAFGQLHQTAALEAWNAAQK
jgi:peptidoglycan hydrolase-like protein with peptidoglycan-binding domain